MEPMLQLAQDTTAAAAAAAATGGGGFNWAYLATVAMAVFFLFACVFLILTVLIQKPQGGGLAGAFGSGAGSGQTAFGTRTGDALTVATIIMFTLYIGSAIGLTYMIRPSAPVVVAPSASGQESAPQGSSPTAGTTPATDTPATETPTPPAGGEAPKSAEPAQTPATTPATPAQPAEQPK